MEVNDQLRAPTALLSRKEPPVPYAYEAGCAPALICTLWKEENSPSPDHNQIVDSFVVQP
jgi:hypothetical protein